MTTSLMTVSKAVKVLKEQNPDCYISKGLIERAIKNNQIGFIPIGNRKLIDIEMVQQYLSTACDPKSPTRFKAVGRR